MDPDTEQVDRAARGRRIFEALRKVRQDESGEVPAASSSSEGSPPSSAPPAPEPGGGGEAPTSATPAPPPPAPPAPVQPFKNLEAITPPEGTPAVKDEEPPPPAVLPGAATLRSQLPDAADEAPAPPVPVEPVPAEEAPQEPDEDVAPEPAHRVKVPVPDIPRVIAIANQKGGVGKTTTSVNLGASLTELGFRVLVVDLDPQGNATTGLGIDIRNLAQTVYDALMGTISLEDCVEPTSVRNLFVAPSNMDLAGAEIELVPMFSRELKLRRAIEGVKDDYDYVLIDCPPSLGLLTVNGLAAADDVVVPIQCEYYALEGLGQLVNNVQLVRSNLNPVLDIRGIILTMYDARTKLSDQVVEEVRSYFGQRVYNTIVPRTVRLSEAPSFGQPIIVYDSSSRGASAYRELAKEVAGGTKDEVTSQAAPA